jgi:hypothetical protein
MTEHPIITSLRAQVEECVALLRPHYPEASDEELHRRAACMRSRRHADGHWPSDTDIAALVERWRAEKREDEAMPWGVVMRFPGDTLL